MGRQEWEDSLKVDRLKIKRARMNDDDSSWIDREQTERLNEHVDGALRFLQEVPDAHLDFLNGHLESQCERLYYQTKGNKALVNASQDTNREQRLGVLFFFNLPEWRPSRAALALLLSHCNHGHRHKNDPNQVCGSIQPENKDLGNTPTDRGEKRCICSRLSNYSDKEWNRERPLRLWPYPYFKRQDFFKDRGAVTIQFMFRYAVLSETKGGTQTGDPSWPQTLRSIPSFRRGTGNTDKKATSIIERRHLLFMKYFPRNPKDHDDANSPYHFTLISLGPLRHKELHGIIRSVQEDEAKKAGDLAPIVLFIKYLRLLFLAYTEEWDDILARLDREISFKLSEVEDYSEGSQNHAMMYDDASQNTSTAYFKIFQVLRTLEGMVKETLADFRDWHFKVVTTLDGPSHAFEERQLQAAVGEWRVLGGKLEARLGGIRQRIAEKRADVQSLSDNMFNATSINEARQSTVLNQLVLVFTVVTVVYTPLGFVTALFGMNTIQDGSVLSSSWVPFGYILTIVCLTTYLVTLVSIWWLGWIKLGKGLREYFKSLSRQKTPENVLEHDKTNAAWDNGEEASHPIELGTGHPEDKQVRGSRLV